jgi:hypothetical protein
MAQLESMLQNLAGLPHHVHMLLWWTSLIWAFFVPWLIYLLGGACAAESRFGRAVVCVAIVCSIVPLIILGLAYFVVMLLYGGPARSTPAIAAVVAVAWGIILCRSELKG